MKIYTGRGDLGETSLFGGESINKSAPRVCAYGTVDELNSLLGVARAFSHDEKVRAILQDVQSELFRLGAELADTSGREARIDRTTEENWRHLENVIDELERELPPLKNFILPGGTKGASLIHMARTVCRRAERRIVSLSNLEKDFNPSLVTYMNRLSDLLFVLARFENSRQGGKEEIWRPRGK